MGEWWDPASPVHFRGWAISPKAPRLGTRQRAPLSLSNTTGDGPLGDRSPPRRSSDYIRVAEKSTSPVHFRGRAISPKAPRPQSRNALEMGPYPGSPRATSGEPKTNSAGPDLRSRRRLREDKASTRCARGDGDRLQGSLRPDPAFASTVLCGRQSLRVSQQQRSSISGTPAAWKRGFPSSARTARVSMAKRSPNNCSMVGASMDQGGPAMRDWS